MRQPQWADEQAGDPRLSEQGCTEVYKHKRYQASKPPSYTQTAQDSPPEYGDTTADLEAAINCRECCCRPLRVIKSRWISFLEFIRRHKTCVVICGIVFAILAIVGAPVYPFMLADREVQKNALAQQQEYNYWYNYYYNYYKNYYQNNTPPQ
ncbi:hypothetical protein P168DRAFT_306845 [Aspergillus campestris IBT 28561]|uniref:Uncharacterized protein n=1 Tax=Aspergillus campestris (strain IBT 28561) TaxID=1392248 RepID=A0A2I1CVT8_ASPC2|nr:uncharacterized protein P168DRAFT_306845 [Aspergillus campestris IBT 28561]PKY01731.1 hypothetical protein P168DRAFT_306845 [Aspergillus campestris IBT 28561]